MVRSSTKFYEFWWNQLGSAFIDVCCFTKHQTGSRINVTNSTYKQLFADKQLPSWLELHLPPLYKSTCVFIFYYWQKNSFKDQKYTWNIYLSLSRVKFDRVSFFNQAVKLIILIILFRTITVCPGGSSSIRGTMVILVTYFGGSRLGFTCPNNGVLECEDVT